MRIYKISQSILIGPVYHGTPYDFKLEDMYGASDGVKFFSETKSFAENYASDKSMDSEMDASPKIISAYIRGNVFDPQNEQHIETISPFLPETITVYNDFGMNAKLTIDKWKQLISGIVVDPPYWSEQDLEGKKVGDPLPENDTYGHPLKYEILKLTPDKVYYTFLGVLSTIANGHDANLWDREGVVAKRYSKEEVANDILNLDFVTMKKKYKNVNRSNPVRVMSKPRQAITTTNNDVWRWLEGDGVFEAIQKAGFDIVKSREKGDVTYAVFQSAEITPVSNI